MGVGEPHKLLADFSGVPLVRRSAERAISSNADSVTVVTGHKHEEIEAALIGLEVNLVYNPDFAEGIATSLKHGFAAPSVRQAVGVLVMLADMPNVTVDDLTNLMAAFRRFGGKAIVRGAFNGAPGNPAILPRSLYKDISLLEGDVGARRIIESCGLAVINVEIGNAAIVDVDTKEEVIAAGGALLQRID